MSFNFDWKTFSEIGTFVTGGFTVKTLDWLKAKNEKLRAEADKIRSANEVVIAQEAVEESSLNLQQQLIQLQQTLVGRIVLQEAKIQLLSDRCDTLERDKLDALSRNTVKDQRIKELEDEVTRLESEVSTLKSQVSLLTTRLATQEAK